jgi:N-acetyl-gamma-glutamyl-phosphate reductase
VKKIFIDGSAGTTGLRIRERLAQREDLSLITLPEELRKDTAARKEAMNRADIVFLCLPDAAAIEAVELVENPDTVILDASTAHRTSPGWSYGFPELSEAHLEAVKTAKRIAVPGCHASGFIALIYPLIRSGLLSADARLSCFSLTGYSGGGKSMIAAYEDPARDVALDSPRIYALRQQHKHLKEMKYVTGIEREPIFSPIVADYYSGMLVTVPLFTDAVKGGAETIRDVYRKHYTSDIVHYVEELPEDGFAASNTLSGKDSMEIFVCGSEERLTLCARYDNLGKGASGAAVECMNLVLGVKAETGLTL